MHSTTPLLLHEAFAQQVTRVPQGVALQDRGRVTTYRQLSLQVDRIEALLRNAGVQPGSRVGLYAVRSIEAVAGMLGILRSGAAVVPLSPAEPEALRNEVLHFARIRVVVDTPEAPFPAPASWQGRTIRSDGQESLPDEAVPISGQASTEPRGVHPRANGPTRVHPQVHDLDPVAFILRSSGSTSKPKLIVRSHGSFAHRLRWTWDRHPFQAGEVACQKAPLSTTHAVYELFEPLLKGVPVLLMPDDDVRRLERFWETIREAGVTRLLLVPSALRASLDLPHFTPPPLNVLVLMGEYVSPKLAERTIRTFPAQTHLYSIYGSTEASSTLVCDLRASFRPGAELPLGVPLSPEIRTRILDPDGSPVPEGGTGRLYISGPPLFREYLGDAERTSEVLVDSGEGQEILFDTRDDVRVDGGGDLLFMGRADHTVKIRGFRVDLQEVERAILLHPGVTQAVAAARGKGAASPRLDAWFAPSSVDPASVFAWLRERLPEYMIPASLQAVDRFPLTQSGKVDRRRLSESASSPKPRSAGGGGPVEDADGTTAGIVAAWEDVLGHREFDLDASFFEVGGTSLTAFRAVHAVRAALGLAEDEMDELLLYRFPSIRALADALSPQGPSGGGQGRSGRSPLLVTLRSGTDPARAPLFFLPAAGGTAGVYERLSRHLRTPREIVGIRDPYLWGDRDPRLPFADWAALYVEAIRSHQPSGPYYLATYSSGGAFGFEVARQLRDSGEEIGLLVLVDPLGLDRPDERSFGFWASKATYGSPFRRAIVRLVGLVRALLPSLVGGHRGTQVSNTWAPTEEEVQRLTGEALRSPGQILTISALLEMNTGHPLDLSPQDLAAGEGMEAGEGDPFQILLERAVAAGLDVDPRQLQQMIRQYPLQARAQHRYRLQKLDVPTLLVEPKTRYQGLIKLHLLPYLPQLESLVIPLGEPSERVAHLAERFGAWAPHFRCIRDEVFVTSLARAMDLRLENSLHR